jgi:hypothetical protein
VNEGEDLVRMRRSTFVNLITRSTKIILDTREHIWRYLDTDDGFIELLAFTDTLPRLHDTLADFYGVAL